MPCISEIKKILDVTPIEQAIMLVGIHGIGKSELLKEYYLSKGYAVVILFLGQCADAGDICGLPDRTEVDFFYGEEIVKQKISVFCPPKWWPRNKDARVVIFLDEFNRGKAEVYQCIFDMVLNRKLNGLELPKETRIVAAINPISDEYDYDVSELDPALIDRFNVYNFVPTADEWLDWALEKKVHKYVMGFISKNRQMLDPTNVVQGTDVAGQKQGESMRKADQVYPSRRSWKRVSDILNEHPELLHEDDMTLLRTILIGIVGYGATSAFYQYIKEMAHSISAGRIVTRWDKELGEKIKKLSHQELIHINRELAMYLEAEEKSLFKAASKKESGFYAHNVENYLKVIPKECAAEFMDFVTQSSTKNKTWGDSLLTFNHNLVNWFVNVLHGEDDHDKEVEKMIDQDEHPDKPWDDEKDASSLF